jgi:6-bladed beta-propeller
MPRPQTAPPGANLLGCTNAAPCPPYAPADPMAPSASRAVASPLLGLGLMPGCGRELVRGSWMGRGSGLTLAGALLLVTAGCGGGHAPAAPFATHDSAGVTVAVSGSPAWAAGGGWTVDAQPEVDIGAGQGLEQDLQDVNDAVRLSDGNIAVSDSTNQIRVYDAKGQFVQGVGGSGAGSGRFLSLKGLALAGDTILAFDAGGGRVVQYDGQGKRLGDWSLIATTGALSYYRMGGATSLGVLLLPAVYPAPDAQKPGVYWDTLPNVRYGANGVMRDTVGEFSGMDMYVNGQVSAVPPFGRQSAAAVAGGKLYIGSGGSWEYRVYASDGKLERVARWAHDPPAVTPAMADSLVAASVALVQKPAQRAGLQQLFQLMPRPKSQPAYDALVVDPAGDVWLRDYRPPVLPGHRDWHVFGPDGRLLGAVTMPRDLNVTRVGSDYVLGVWKDDKGADHVQMLHLVKSAATSTAGAGAG